MSTPSTFRIGAFKVTPAVTRLIAAVVGAGLLAWAGFRIARAGAAHRSELLRAEATLATFSEWQRRYEPAVAAESIAWRRTLMELQALGIVGDERLALTRLISRAAETAGLRDVKVEIGEADTTGSDERLSTEGVRRQSAPFGLIVECRGNLRAVVAFLGALPLSVAPTDLSLVRQDGRARHRLTLAVYELQLSSSPFVLNGHLGPNGASPLWSSRERGDSRRGGIARSGG